MKQIIKIIPLVAASFVIASCGNNGVSHRVEFSAKHGEWHGSQNAYEGTNYVATFSPETGYELKGSDLYVLVGTSRTNQYTFIDNKLTLLGGAITGDVKITANASAIEYSIVNNIENATIGSTKAYHNQTLNLTIKARDYYILPDAIKVYVEDEELTSGYTYSPDDNLLTIEGKCVTGTITVSGKSIELYQVVFKAGDSGTWSDSSIKYAYVKKGATFADARKQVSNPTAKSDGQEFDCWLHEGSPIEEETEKIEEYGYVAEAKYRDLVLYISGSSSYQFDWDGILRDSDAKTFSYGDDINPITVDFETHPVPPEPGEFGISMADEGSYITPSVLPTDKDYEGTIKVTHPNMIVDTDATNWITVTRLGDQPITDVCTYEVAEDKKSVSLTIPLNELTNDIEVTVMLTNDPNPTDREYIMPDPKTMTNAIKITSLNRKSSQTTTLTMGTDYTADRLDDRHLVIDINSSGARGDLTIEVNPYFEAKVEFDPGEGTWDGIDKNPKTAVIRIGGPDPVKFSILEALRIKAGKTGAVEPTKDGKVFKGWQNEKGDMVEVNNIVGDSMKLQAVYGDDVGFETDSWENIIKYANEGIDTLVSQYKLGSADNLIGATRNIVTGNKDIGYYLQKAVVIGYNHDEIYGTKTDERATLTFMFQKVFAESVFDQPLLGHIPNRWNGSSLQSNLVKSLSGFVPDIANNIVHVAKRTYYQTSVPERTSGWDDTEETFFPFSQNELNITSGSGSDVQIEGAPYAYFTRGGSLKRDSVLVDDSSYWLRSSYVKDESGKYVHYIDEEGNVKNDIYSASHGLAVGFCIGQAKK